MSETHSDQPAIQKAGLEDFPELQRLLDAANEYSANRSGLRQWTLVDKAYADLHYLVGKGLCYAIRNSGGEITSSISLSEDAEDNKDWGETAQDNLALYFRKLMRNPATAEAGEGLRLIQFAANEAQRRHKLLLRCDTGSYMPGLVNYYLSLGFEPKGTFTYMPANNGGVLLESPAETILERIAKKS